MQPRFNRFLRSVLRAGAWAMAPFCLGLLAALLLVLAQFVRELIHAVAEFPGMTGPDVILIVLKLVDLMLLGNLVIMIVVAGIEIFAPTAPDPQHERPEHERPQHVRLQHERPEWDGIMGFAGLKPKLFASISAIAAIDLLESFINIEAADKSAVGWELLILITFVLAGAVLAWMDKIMHEKH